MSIYRVTEVIGTSTTSWEDAAVPPDRLGSYLRAIFALMREYDYDSPMYGHFGEGCVHMRINFDLETEPGILNFREFIDRAARVNGDGGRAALDTLGQQFHERSLVVLAQQGAEILQEFRARRERRMQSRPSRLAGRRQLDPVGRKPVAHQFGANTVRDPVLVEYGK